MQVDWSGQVHRVLPNEYIDHVATSPQGVMFGSDRDLLFSSQGLNVAMPSVILAMTFHRGDLLVAMDREIVTVDQHSGDIVASWTHPTDVVQCIRSHHDELMVLAGRRVTHRSRVEDPETLLFTTEHDMMSMDCKKNKIVVGGIDHAMVLYCMDAGQILWSVSPNPDDALDVHIFFTRMTFSTDAKHVFAEDDQIDHIYVVDAQTGELDDGYAGLDWWIDDSRYAHKGQIPFVCAQNKVYYVDLSDTVQTLSFPWNNPLVSSMIHGGKASSRVAKMVLQRLNC